MAKMKKSCLMRSIYESYLSEHYRYIDVVRRPDGTLRPWDEHNILCHYERKAQYFDDMGYGMAFPCKEALDIKDKEDGAKYGTN